MLTTEALIPLNERVHAVNTGATWWVRRFLGEGSQGAVFEVDNREGEALALKWYHPAAATRGQLDALTYLLDQDAPSERFLWPVDLAAIDGVSGFGYLMPLRDAGFIGMSEVVARKKEISFGVAATVALQLAESFLFLHSRGLCYRDISFGNVFLDAADGSVLICDVDNVGIDGRSTSQVLGTPYFMAPEVLVGEALPSTQTDHFSLAVLLFFLFINSHPLEGRRALNFEIWDEVAQMEVFGRNPLFIFDSVKSSNRPVPGYQDSPIELWPVYPQFLRDRFHQAFESGLADADNSRVADSVWRSDMVRLRDSILSCEKCRRQNFFEPGKTLVCWSCGAKIANPLRLRFAEGGGRSKGWREIVLNPDSVVYQHHLLQDYDFSRVVARVVPHPWDQRVRGLKNLSSRSWTATTRDGRQQQGSPGSCLTLAPGVSVDFGPARGEIVRD